MDSLFPEAFLEVGVQENHWKKVIETRRQFATNNGRPILPWEAFSICDDLSGILGKTIDETQLFITNNLKLLSLVRHKYHAVSPASLLCSL